ncbi:MAG: DRTGG domain-containing protein [Bacteroidia bacterium]|nr:DRTGG domain-containing protein [Bacteroidia bacterium]
MDLQVKPEDRKRIIEIEKIRQSLNATVIVGNNIAGIYVTGIFASDLMSDVLAYGKSGEMLITGLNNVQAAISAYMAEFKGIIFIRNKIPDEDVTSFAREKGMIILSTDADMYEACVEIANVEGEIHIAKEVTGHTGKVDNATSYSFSIDGRDFATAGLVSTQVKTILKSIGYDPLLIRRVAISTYEAEMNVVMHAERAVVTLVASDKEINIQISDKGKGIENIELAMQEGYSTATEEQRALGFGAGMGLPNIKKNADKLNIESIVNKGTNIETIFYVK